MRIEALRRFEGGVETVSTIYLVDSHGTLAGAVPLAKIVLATPDTPMLSLTQEPLISTHAGAKEKEVAELFDKYNLLNPAGGGRQQETDRSHHLRRHHQPAASQSVRMRSLVVGPWPLAQARPLNLGQHQRRSDRRSLRFHLSRFLYAFMLIGRLQRSLSHA